MLHKIIVKTIGIGFILGGIIHILIILGIMTEVTPLIITIYFHSLSILSPITGIGLLLSKKWGRKLGFFIALTQIPAHSYMVWLDNFTDWQSGISFGERAFDIAFAVFYIIFFNTRKVKRIFT